MTTSLLRPLVVLVPLLGLAGGCTASRVAQREDSLAAAGFVIRPANTPQRAALLKRLPAHRFVRREHGDKVNFVYADPLVCGCLYVGSQEAYNQYKRDRQQKQLADEQQMTANAYEDSTWDWNAWGPADGWGMQYDRGPGW